MSKKELSNKTVVELKEICKKNLIKGYSKLRKVELIKLILSFFKKTINNNTYKNNKEANQIKNKFFKKAYIQKLLNKYKININLTKGVINKITRYIKNTINGISKHYDKLVKLFNNNTKVVNELCKFIKEV